MTGEDLFLISSAVWGGVIVTAALIAFGVEKSRAKKRHAKRGHLQMVPPEPFTTKQAMFGSAALSKALEDMRDQLLITETPP